jgi:hypothetical protein
MRIGLGLLSRRAIALLALATVLVAIVAAAAAHAATPTQRHYPPAVRNAFISSCTKAAKATAGSRLTKAQASTYCRSALSCIERHLTLTQFARTVRNMQQGKRNPNARVFTSCERAALRKITS